MFEASLKPTFPVDDDVLRSGWILPITSSKVSPTCSEASLLRRRPHDTPQWQLSRQLLLDLPLNWRSSALRARVQAFFILVPFNYLSNQLICEVKKTFCECIMEMRFCLPDLTWQ
eukprot:g14954.t1